MQTNWYLVVMHASRPKARSVQCHGRPDVQLVKLSRSFVSGICMTGVPSPNFWHDAVRSSYIIPEIFRLPTPETPQSPRDCQPVQLISTGHTTKRSVSVHYISRSLFIQHPFLRVLCHHASVCHTTSLGYGLLLDPHIPICCIVRPPSH